MYDRYGYIYFLQMVELELWAAVNDNLQSRGYKTVEFEQDPSPSINMSGIRKYKERCEVGGREGEVQGEEGGGRELEGESTRRREGGRGKGWKRRGGWR